jgi:hypothetical protein
MNNEEHIEVSVDLGPQDMFYKGILGPELVAKINQRHLGDGSKTIMPVIPIPAEIMARLREAPQPDTGMLRPWGHLVHNGSLFVEQGRKAEFLILNDRFWWVGLCEE